MLKIDFLTNITFDLSITFASSELIYNSWFEDDPIIEHD